MRAFHTLTLLVATVAAQYTRLQRRAENDSSAFDWYSLVPSDDIFWTPCFGSFKCARLNAPLDYNVPNGTQIQLALQLFPAPDQENRAGTIFINPGGPGDSATSFLLADVDKLSSLFGPTFDILAFDPRGVGATTPRVYCFDSPEHADAFGQHQNLVLRDGDGSIPRARAQKEVIGSLCKDKVGDAAQFMDTEHVATDMLHLLSKIGQEKLLYWGISYGTVLGQYFASLFPEKIERMVLDGIADGEEWQAGNIVPWIADADKIMAAFFANCAAAGSSKCAIAEATAEEVEARLERILTAVENDPIPIPQSLTGPYVYTSDNTALLIISSLYAPLAAFPVLAETLRALETRNLTFLAQQGYISSDVGQQPWQQSSSAQFAIECSDFPQLDGSLNAAIATVRNATAVSKWLGPIWSILPIACGAWPIQAKDRYTGSVSSTSDTPILGISNLYDAVTPLSGARAVSQRFGGMQLLEHNTVGHTAFLSLSTCVADAVQTYFTSGQLPREGTVCEPDELPLLGPRTQTE
ncbi:alpha/beta-hydrolase [Exidia glandulosa HHB12029]|uniref:Alpha/beta-hydrolase n=1 Tax=Exidia glandulosa HHB12029 TaxID=1314781 RepID=A0A165J532_EXIGL|nr:alpha/beta-hydrolase [Exidia glandulosa HHB12029]